MEAAFTIITGHASTWILTAALVSVSSTYVAAQVAGTTTIGVAVAEVDIVAKGWSAKKHILGEPVFNEKSEKVGKIHDLIVAPDKSVSYAIVRTGTFAGLPKHDVAIPVSQFQEKDGKFILAGATKAAIKALPPFEYAKAGK
jgi:sporulation protein YlmC with PRC-barrel domain